MPSEENHWDIQIVQDRYSRYKISLEQAELIYKYEQEKLSFSSKYFLSDWEDWDYEATVFKDIFSEKQFAAYKRNLKRSLQQYENNIIAGDKDQLKEIEYHLQILSYYQKKFIPMFSGKPFLILSMGIRDEQSKIDFLKAEYKKFLNDSKTEIIASHFRHKRTLAPNELKASLLRHKIKCIWPDYLLFKYKMDEPTKIVSEYLEKRLTNTLEEIDEAIEMNLKKLGSFHNRLFKKYHGREGGWHFIISKMSAEEEKIQIIMSYFLLDKDQYGYVP